MALDALDRPKKSQIAIEFVIVYSFVLLIFILIFALVATEQSSLTTEQQSGAIQLLTESIAGYINQAVTAGNGYSTNVSIPAAVGSTPYTLELSNTGVIITEMKIATQVITAEAFSSARNIIVNGTLSDSQNGINVYSIPVYKGVLQISNSHGIIYIDESPPSVLSLPGSATLSNIFSSAVGNFSSTTVYNPGCGPYSASSSSCIVANVPISGTDPKFTIAGWVNIPGLTGGQSWTEPFIGFNSYQGFGFLASGAGLVLHRCSSADTSVSLPGITNYGSWNFFAVSVNSPNYLFQYDNANVTTTNTNSWSNSNQIMIGGQFMDCDGNPFRGELANVQVYSAALTASQLETLYQGGMGSPPINMSELAGWWPLANNTNDYSSYADQGVAYGPVSYLYTSEFVSKVLNFNGSPSAGTLVGYVSSNGKINNVGRSLAEYTPISGVSKLFISSNLPLVSNLTMDVFNGNTSTESNLTAWYPLNLGYGNEAYDLSTHYNNGTFSGGSWQPMSTNSTEVVGAYFNGSSRITSMLTEKTISGITISAWVNPVNLGNFPQNIAEINGTPYTTQTIGIEITKSSAVISWSNIADTYSDSYQGNKPGSGEYLVTGVWNGTNNTMQLYINGRLVASGLENGTKFVALTNINIGGAFPGANPFNGIISNVQIYDAPIGQQQIENLYLQGPSSIPIGGSSLIGWWPFSGSISDFSKFQSSASVKNVSFKTYQYYNSSSTKLSVPTFNGLGGYIAIPPLAALNGKESFSVNTWLEYKGGSNYFSQNQYPVGWPGCTTGFEFTPPSNITFTYWYGSSPPTSTGCPPSPAGDIAPQSVRLEPGEWYMLTATYNSKTGNLVLYENGEEYSNASLPSGAYPGNFYETGYIGDALDGNTGTQYFNGSVTDLQIYNSTLTPMQVGQLYEEGLPMHKVVNFTV
ncbi:MAG: LamG-like jellyroll fold domain-containing protein [Candidatus Micrarchaeaceae archaeon]